MHKIIQGDCRDLLAGVTVTSAVPFHRVRWLELPDNSIDAIVTDPPYGLSFMCKNWDQVVPGPEYWRAALRVAKPGAHLVAFGGTRTVHRLACAIEDSGWEIRDRLMWLYGSGFPKSHNVALGIDKKAGHENRGRAIPTASRYQATDRLEANKLESNPVESYRAKTEAARPWQGWGTALKPAWEPIILARKPFPGTVADNVLKHGTGALNVDSCRIPTEKDLGRRNNENATWGTYGNGPSKYAGIPVEDQGRWPANLILDETSAAMLDEQSGESKSTGGKGIASQNPIYDGTQVGHYLSGVRANMGGVGDFGGASRFFYTSKASRTEREAGLEDCEIGHWNDGRKTDKDYPSLRKDTPRKNNHPTVKPLDLMRWLVRLVTPPGGTVLDPFCGSGTTIAAALAEGFNAIGIDIDGESCEIAVKRAANAKVEAGTATQQDAARLAGSVQLGLFGDNERG